MIKLNLYGIIFARARYHDKSIDTENEKGLIMFNIQENATKNYKLIGLQLGSMLGLFASLSLKDGMVPAFIICLGLGYGLGAIYQANKR